MSDRESGSLQLLVQRAEKAEATVKMLRKVLSGVPHSTGDHSDLCRMHNDGRAPRDETKCLCHVGKVKEALRVFTVD